MRERSSAGIYREEAETCSAATRDGRQEDAQGVSFYLRSSDELRAARPSTLDLSCRPQQTRDGSSSPHCCICRERAAGGVAPERRKDSLPTSCSAGSIDRIDTRPRMAACRTRREIPLPSPSVSQSLRLTISRSHVLTLPSLKVASWDRAMGKADWPGEQHGKDAFQWRFPWQHLLCSALLHLPGTSTWVGADGPWPPGGRQGRRHNAT